MKQPALILLLMLGLTLALSCGKNNADQDHDSGVSNNTGSERPDPCEGVICDGDNIPQSQYGEECDDGDSIDDNGCSNGCKVVMGS